MKYDLSTGKNTSVFKILVTGKKGFMIGQFPDIHLAYYCEYQPVEEVIELVFYIP